MMKKTVLILCTGNSCRSQMAEGVLRHYGSDKFEVLSAGTKPSIVNKNAIKVMREIGIDISRHRSKHIDEFLGQKLITLFRFATMLKNLVRSFRGERCVYIGRFPIRHMIRRLRKKF